MGAMVKIDDRENRRAMALAMIEELNAWGISRYRFARLAGISDTTIKYWVKDDAAPTVKHLAVVIKIHRRFSNAKARKRAGF